MRKGVLILLLIFLAACGSASSSSDAASQAKDLKKQIGTYAILKNAQGVDVASAKFEEYKKGVRISLQVWNITSGTHGIHIHESKSCFAPSFDSAGDHFNPTSKTHGKDSQNGPHAGDLRNIEVKSNKTIYLKINAPSLSLDRRERNSVHRQSNTSLGTSIVIHEGPDDMVTNPSGNSGRRVACGSIVQNIRV